MARGLTSDNAVKPVALLARLQPLAHDLHLARH